MKAGKITLLIVDRSIDAVTPILRDFFYQPMLYDLKKVENDLIEYDAEDNTGK